MAIGSKKDDNVNVFDVHAKKHLVAAQIQANTGRSLRYYLLSWRKQRAVVHYEWSRATIFVLILNKQIPKIRQNSFL